MRFVVSNLTEIWSFWIETAEQKVPSEAMGIVSSASLSKPEISK